jgi:hypothetical protein
MTPTQAPVAEPLAITVIKIPGQDVYKASAKAVWSGESIADTGPAAIERLIEVLLDKRAVNHAQIQTGSCTVKGTKGGKPYEKTVPLSKLIEAGSR